MNRFRFALYLLLLIVTTSSGQPQTSSTALCDGIVARVRVAADADPWTVLTKGERPFVEIEGEDETKALAIHDANATTDEVVNRFITRFNPSTELRKAWVDLQDAGHLNVGKLANSDLHMVTATGGTALCMSFTFFSAPNGKQAQLLPDLPLKSDRDGDRLICNKSGSDGYLARVGGVEAFVETYTSEQSQYIRVVPLRDGRWSVACKVDAAYGMKYETRKAFVPEKSLLTEAELKTLASQIVERREAVKDAKDFSFGPSLSERDREEVRTMSGLVEKMDPQTMPTFGRDSELGNGEDTLRSGDSFPVVVGGKAHLLRIGEGQLGCCYFPGPLLIFYTLKDGELEPAASAIVDKSRGSLKSIQASASR
jgi:hypothetical protein